MSGLAAPLCDGAAWWAWAALAGVGPLVLGCLLGTRVHQPLTALLLFLLMLPALRDDREARGMGVLAIGFGLHCVCAVLLARLDPVRAAAAMPDAVGYFEAQLVWIETGTDPEYDWVNWVPAHLHMLVGIGVLALASMGLLPLVEGVYQADLMNFYVGNLLGVSDSAVTALALGWHPWSVIRGLCYVVLVYEVASIALQWWSGRPLSSRAARTRRWLVIGALFLADGVVKWVLLDVVRAGLASNLVGI